MMTRYGRVFIPNGPLRFQILFRALRSSGLAVRLKSKIIYYTISVDVFNFVQRFFNVLQRRQFDRKLQQNNQSSSRYRNPRGVMNVFFAKNTISLTLCSSSHTGHLTQRSVGSRRIFSISMGRKQIKEVEGFTLRKLLKRATLPNGSWSSTFQKLFLHKFIYPFVFYSFAIIEFQK